MVVRNILVSPGVGNYCISGIVTDDAILPGSVVTTVSMTADTYNVCWPDAANETTLGIAGCSEGHDIATAYTVGDTIPVYPVGHSACVWVLMVANCGAIKRGGMIESSGVTADGLAILGTDEPITVGYEKIGRAAMECADNAANHFCKVILTGH